MARRDCAASPLTIIPAATTSFATMLSNQSSPLSCQALNPTDKATTEDVIPEQGSLIEQTVSFIVVHQYSPFLSP